MDEFDALLVKVLGGCFCVLVLTIGGCVGFTNYKIATAPDPIAASCATGMSTYSCVVANRKEVAAKP